MYKYTLTNTRRSDCPFCGKNGKCSVLKTSLAGGSAANAACVKPNTTRTRMAIRTVVPSMNNGISGRSNHRCQPQQVDRSIQCEYPPP